MWQIEPTSQFQHDLKYYERKRPNELAAVLRNLERYISFLNAAKNSRTIQAGFLHPEPLGIVAIAQNGGGPNLQETRLYTYAVDSMNILYIITLGDKREQPSDIEFSKTFVRSLTKPPQQQFESK